MPPLVGRKALHQHADLAGQVGFELQVADFEVVQQLLGQGLDVALIHQSIHQLQGPPPAPKHGFYNNEAFVKCRFLVSCR